MDNLICNNLVVDENGTLIFGGHSTAELINKYASPMYVMDEARIRYNMRLYVSAMRKYFG